MPASNTTIDYINTVEYDKLSKKLHDLVSTMDDLARKNTVTRKMRYSEVDVEAERGAGRLQPDELMIPQHIIDSNIRREQASYVQYVTQSPRAVILQNIDDPAVDTTQLERDATNRIRFNGWQLSMFPNIDGMQQNGYGALELVMDQTQPGELAHEFVQMGDLGLVLDTKDIQETEMVARNYYFSKTRLVAMCSDKQWGFSKVQVDRIVEQEPRSTDDDTTFTTKDRSLYKIQKVMFRVGGVVQVAWACENICDDWIRPPRPLYIGRRKAKESPTIIELLKSKVAGKPATEAMFETRYPYFIFPYLISENNTISQLKGRGYLDQDTQMAVTSIVSSYCTGLRRSAGLYFSKDVSDPNDDLLGQKNVFFRSGALINSKVTQFQLTPPPADTISAVNMLVTANQQETSQVNFAAQNRKDSRKTATEISAATQASQSLSTVQVVLFSNAIKSLYTTMFEVIQSRVNAGLLEVRPELKPLYEARYSVKPSGDTDVIERQQLVQAMVQAWPTIQGTPLAAAFFMDLISKMFPEYSAKYLAILQGAQQQQQSQEAMMKQQVMAKGMEMAQGVKHLADNPEYFSDIGKIHALPAVKKGAEQIDKATGQ